MATINENFLKLKAGYLFPEIARRVNEFADANPGGDLIKMGIGDVTEPLPPAIIEAMHQAVDEMGAAETFRGYGPEQGYGFLREAIAKFDYSDRGIEVSENEIFISDGSKCDSGNLLDIFGHDNTIAVLDPVYPVYVDTNVMAGNTGEADSAGRYANIVYLPVTEDNNFEPQLPDQKVDLIYLCYPNNPTGVVASKELLQKWVDYARENESVIFYDAAYEAFITDPDVPRSIYEIPGARDVAIELRSFSKNAGFTGTRCAFTVIPKTLTAITSNGSHHPVHPLWNRRHSTKFNGVSYIIQRGAEAAYSPAGQEQISQLVNFYLENASIMKSGLENKGYRVFGGVNAPYVWLKTPDGQSSWDFFDHLLREHNVVATPGSGFGAAGEGYIRLSAFNSRANIEKAMQRLT